MWHRLTDYQGQLNLALTLQAGQVFCWEKQGDEWVGVIDNTVYYLVQTEDDHVDFRTYPECSKKESLRTFFQLHTDLLSFLIRWKSIDPVFDKLVDLNLFQGLRICQQDPFECLISFIVSANNNIKRISQNLRSIRKSFGKHLVDNVHAFPTVEELATATVDELKGMGLGYRARYICETVKLWDSSKRFLIESPESLIQCRTELMQFPGVGRKVADCVLLYSMGFDQVVPVDTHMLQLAQTLSGRQIKKDNAMHAFVENFMTEKFGHKAGWAQAYLFAAKIHNKTDTSKKLKTK